MRIISGKHRGVKIDFLKSKTTRPLKDSVKENIFNILSHSKKINIDVNKSKILDIYAGIGSFGLECISRGAEEVTFIEHNKEVINILEKNCKKFSILNQVILINNNVDDFLNLNSKKKYNIIFFDPPFADKEFVKILKILKNKKNFEKNHIIIIHRERGSNDYFEDLLNILLIRSYGRSKIIFGKF